MIKNIKNEFYKIYKSKRLFIFSISMILVSVLMGVLVSIMEKQGAVPKENMEMIIGGAFPLQVLSIIADMVLPLLSTLLVCFLFIDEYNNGTLKLPLLCGHKRVVLLLAKALVIALTMLIIMIVSYLSATITGMAFWGFKAVISTTLETFLVYMETYFAIVSWTVIVLLLGLFMQNSGTMIGIVSVLLVVGSLVTSLFPESSKLLIPYYFKAFATMTDWRSVLFGIGVCFETIIIFGMMAYGRFNQMEISK